MNNDFEQRMISSRDNLFSRLDVTRNNWRDSVSDNFYAMTEKADFKGKIDNYISTLNNTLSSMDQNEAKIAKLAKYDTVDALMDVDFQIFSDPSLSFNDSGALRFMAKGVDLALKGAVVGVAAGAALAGKAIKNQMKKNEENSNDQIPPPPVNNTPTANNNDSNSPIICKNDGEYDYFYQNGKLIGRKPNRQRQREMSPTENSKLQKKEQINTDFEKRQEEKKKQELNLLMLQKMKNQKGK
jgi:hypothetical protein